MDAVVDVEHEEDEERSGFALMVAERVRRARVSSRMKLKDVAILCATTPQTIQRLETGNMTMSVAWLGKLCRALRIEPVDLFDPKPMVKHREKLPCRPVRSVSGALRRL